LKRVLLAVTNDLTHDQRVHRIATTLTTAGWLVTVVGRRRRESVPLEDRLYNTFRLRLLFRKGKLFYLEFAFRLFWWMMRNPKQTIICANDLDTLLPCWLVARLRGSRIAYDSHEYFTEVPELKDRVVTKQLWLWLEKWLLPRVDVMYTVNSAIAGLYGGNYQRTVHVVRNLPLKQHVPPAPPKVPNAPFILLYQGMVNVSRGVDLMIRTLVELPNCELWVAGGGDVLGPMKALAEELGVAKRVKFYGMVKLEQLPALTRQAHIGLSLEEDRGLNYRLATPNKIVDYLQAGIPVIVSDLPLMSALVLDWQVGRVLSIRTPKALSLLIEELLVPDAYLACANKARIAAQTLNWEAEQATLLSIYNELNER
jgi:glycosyltransferase involved in cell wall biosynthesis